MTLPAIAGVSLLFVGGPAKADPQGWPLAGNWGSSSSGGSSLRSYSRPYYATYPSSFGSYAPSGYATYQMWSPQPWGHYGYESPPNFYRRSPTEGYYGSTGSGAYYQSSIAAFAGKHQVRVNLRVPSDAKVWFDESQTHQTGTTRSFESPPVAAGREYVYQLRIQWQQDGKIVTQTRDIKVHAGDVINLTVGSPAESVPAG
jgi:uncharacterized protein (TIGR03000 family)